MSTWLDKLFPVGRFKTFAAVGVSLLVLVGTMSVLVPRHEPRVATAADSVIGPAAAPSAAQSGEMIAADDSLQQWLRQPIEPLNRNVFSIDSEQFAPAGANGPAAAELPGVLSPPEAKSPPGQADGNRGEMVRVEDLRLQAGRIRLQSTLMGAMPRALVNGRTVREGDVVASFRVLKIEARRIILEREGIKLEVPLM